MKARSYASGETMRIAAGEKLVVDFGQNAAAVPFFRFKAAAGRRDPRVRTATARVTKSGAIPHLSSATAEYTFGASTLACPTLRASFCYNVGMILGKDGIERLPPPVGTSDWARFSRDSYCVDKTLMIKELIDTKTRVARR